ncbi:hypothetical protein DW886_29135 [Enterocloster aldenensis]|nr:hypothetical protein DW886_29135 [Enterocloster aldenensis]
MREQLPRSCQYKRQVPGKLLLPVKAADAWEDVSASISRGCLGSCFCRYRRQISRKPHPSHRMNMHPYL